MCTFEIALSMLGKIMTRNSTPLLQNSKQNQCLIPVRCMNATLFSDIFNFIISCWVISVSGSH